MEGSLELFRKFIRFGRARLPLILFWLDLFGFVGVTHNNLCGLITVPTLASGSFYSPFLLWSIIYALPAGLHPVIWQTNLHKASVWWWHRCHVMPCAITVQSQQNIQCECVIGGWHNNQTALLFTHCPLNVYPSPKFPPVAPWFSPDWNLLSPSNQQQQPPAAVSGQPYVMFAQWSHQSL